MEIEQRYPNLLENALEAFKRVVGLQARIVLEDPEERLVAIECDARDYVYRAELKRIDRFEALGQIKQFEMAGGDPVLLIAPRITPETAEKCRELDLQFIDACGNAYLRRDGLFIYIKGQRPDLAQIDAGQRTFVTRAGTATNLRVIFTLLTKRDALNAPYREINQHAGVALGAVGLVFNDLKNRGYITGGVGKEDRLLLERARLIQEWATNYPIRLKPKLHLRRFHAENENWWKDINITEFQAQWGGEVAGDKLTGYLRPTNLTIYIQEKNFRENLKKLVLGNRLAAHPNGEIEILEAFWEINEGEPMDEIVPALLVYADLNATLDPRNIETARMVYERYLVNNEDQG